RRPAPLRGGSQPAGNRRSGGSNARLPGPANARHPTERGCGMTLPADLNTLLDDLRPAAARAIAIERHRRHLTVAVAAALAAALCAGIAVAAVTLLGRPA